MKKLLLVTLISLISFTVLSQSCLPEGITFETQSQIDSFQIIYPNCTEIEGYVMIKGEDINNLIGLSILNEIGEELVIGGNPALTNLSGLENVNSIGGNLTIGWRFQWSYNGNPLLVDLTGLNNLSTVGGRLEIGYNSSLNNLVGLENISSIGGGVSIIENNSLANLTGLNNITSINGNLTITHNEALTSLTGLNNLDSIGGWLQIGEFEQNLPKDGGNDLLTNLFGLGNLTTIGDYLIIINNSSLSDFSGIENLISVGSSFTVARNNQITSLTGFENLTLIGGDFKIERNDGLINLTGLNNLTSIGETLQINHNDTLINLIGLESLTSIGNYTDISYNEDLINLSGIEGLESLEGYLRIANNNSLSDITALQNIDASTIESLNIQNNTSLTDCDAEGICSYLSSPNGAINIYNNSTGCNNPPEIASNCGVTLSCLPYGNYYLLNQSEIDNFQSDYQDCENLKGNVTISGTDIVNLNGLSNITTIENDLDINNNDGLSTLEGLNNLTSIGERLYIFENYHLSDLSGLENLKKIGINISIGILKWINPGYIDSGNPSLKNLNGLESLDTIGGIYIRGNDSLISLAGLNNVNSNLISSLHINGNHFLSKCEIQSICDYLDKPVVEVYIDDNSSGCNSQEEVEEACIYFSVQEIPFKEKCKTFPNPFTTSTTLSYDLKQPEMVSLNIYNHLGQMVYQKEQQQPQGNQQLIWNAEGYANGIYYYRLQVGDAVANGKMVKANNK